MMMGNYFVLLIIRLLNNAVPCVKTFQLYIYVVQVVLKLSGSCLCRNIF
jgi:hypothetical protein